MLATFFQRRWVIGGGLVLGISVVLLVPQIFADRLTSTPTVDSTYVGGETPALLNAPTEIQDCVKAQIGEEAFEAIATKTRVMDAAAEEILNACFRPQSDHGAESEVTTTTPAQPITSPSPSSSSPTSTSTSTPSTVSEPTTRSATDDIHAEVWTKNGYDGASYEYKVNCGSGYAKLEECFLWDLTRVSVQAPGGTSYELSKDFNVNSYSGETTRRWVLYDPGGGGLPAAGSYIWRYYQGSSIVHQHALDYTPEVVAPPSGVTYTRSGNDLTISWQAPAGISSSMWYKPSIDPPGNDRQIISKVIAWDQTSATLADVPVNAGEQIEINVAVFFPGGYAYPQPIKVTW